MKRIVFDLDNTLCHCTDGDYSGAIPDLEVIKQLQQYRNQGFEIIIYTSRNMRTHQSNIGKINALTLPTVLDWLSRHNVPFDEIYVGKPWCGEDGFYVDDRAVRPDELKRLNYEEILALVRLTK
jgi:capsule biosynthesis phosphatase